MVGGLPTMGWISNQWLESSPGGWISNHVLEIQPLPLVGPDVVVTTVPHRWLSNGEKKLTFQTCPPPSIIRDVFDQSVNLGRYSVSMLDPACSTSLLVEAGSARWPKQSRHSGEQRDHSQNSRELKCELSLKLCPLQTC